MPAKAKQAKAKAETLTAQQEKFAREYVRCGIASRAYRLAYRVRPGTKPESIWQEASHILAEPKVSSRIAELTAKAAEKAVVSKVSLTLELEQVRISALESAEPNFAAANQAIMGKAKINNFGVDRVELTGKDGAALQVETEISVEARTANDIARRVAWLLRKGQKAKASQAE